MEPIRDYVLRAVAGRKNQVGDGFRLRHEYSKDGEPCTGDDKAPAMTVTRLSNGFVFHCHRCGDAGFIRNDEISPRMTGERLNQLFKAQTQHKAAVEKVTLPYDFIPMNEWHKESIAPYKAYHWIWQYSLGKEDMERWNIGYSPSYERIIMPIYEYALLGDVECKKLKGWVGREVKYNTKEERNKAKVSKYLTKKTKGDTRAYFHCPAISDTPQVVLVEDIVSAIKVWNALKGVAECIALLTTTIDNDLVVALRNKKIWLWLDGNMVRKSVATVSRLRDLGLSAHHVHTPKDPKEYNELFIADMWRSRQLSLRKE